MPSDSQPPKGPFAALSPPSHTSDPASLKLDAAPQVQIVKRLMDVGHGPSAGLHLTACINIA